MIVRPVSYRPFYRCQTGNGIQHSRQDHDMPDMPDFDPFADDVDTAAAAVPPAAELPDWQAELLRVANSLENVAVLPDGQDDDDDDTADDDDDTEDTEPATPECEYGVSYCRGDSRYNNPSRCREHAMEYGDYSNCAVCSERIVSDHDDYSYCGDCSSVLCEDCNSSECCPQSGHGYVHDWNYRPSSWRPKGDYPDAPLLGVELEVGGNPDRIVPAVHLTDDTEHHVFMKEDGSIDGVEIVAHPATLAWSNNWGGWDDILARLRREGCHVNDGYGLHVHVSRNAFRVNGKKSARHAMAWLLFIYRNSDHVESLARRHGSRWCRFETQQRGELARKAMFTRISDYMHGRYVAVNCENERTYELRFFGSTLDPVEFAAALEFATATVEYTRTLSSADALNGGMEWHRFAAFVRSTTEYPNLEIELARTTGDAIDGPTGQQCVYPLRESSTAYGNAAGYTRYYV